tara:strand:- start:797 stop:976 length:180 start_codon:yes stop_codon:yes gene_type:complete
MPSKFYKYKNGKIIEFNPEKEIDNDKPNNYINMRKTWSNTTKVEFSHSTVEQDIANRKK